MYLDLLCLIQRVYVRALVVGDEDLQRCLQTESLNIWTDEEPKVVGSMCIGVAMKSETGGPPTLAVRVESTGKINGSPCGTVIDARLSLRLETLEHRHQEVVKVRLITCLVTRQAPERGSLVKYQAKLLCKNYSRLHRPP